MPALCFIFALNDYKLMFSIGIDKCNNNINTILFLPFASVTLHRVIFFFEIHWERKWCPNGGLVGAAGAVSRCAGTWEQYEDAEFWAAHRNVFFQTEKGMEEYTVVSVLKTDIRKFPFTKTQFPDEASLKEYAELAKSQEVFENSRAVRVQYCICMERLVRHDFKSLDNYLDTY